jgi:hypothetical protein
MQQTVLNNTEADIMASATVKNGFMHIPASYYVDDADEREVQNFQSSYFVLPPDEKGGQRYRTYKSLHLAKGQLTQVESAGYVQSKEYNQDLGDVIRIIAPMDEGVFALGVLQKVIQMDIDLAKKMDILSFDNPIKIGLHQVRYNPTRDRTSFSSPPGLHKDDEDIVFIHIVNVSSNLLGGENVVCTSAVPKITDDAPPYLAHINLTEPLEALCVTKKHYHQVFPMSVASGKSAYRDILLVTFENVK